MTIVIAAGGTGGHLYPAVALAREFLSRDPTTKVLFVGTARFRSRLWNPSMLMDTIAALSRSLGDISGQ